MKMITMDASYWSEIATLDKRAAQMESNRYVERKK